MVLARFTLSRACGFRTSPNPTAQRSSEMETDPVLQRRIASLITDQDEMAQTTLTQLTGTPFSFAKSLEVIIEDGVRLETGDC